MTLALKEDSVARIKKPFIAINQLVTGVFLQIFL
jgi:hypothetical protein